MKFADPHTVTCPGCSRDALHPVAALRALVAECPSCHRSLRDVGEHMNNLVREVSQFGVALAISLAIEDLDGRLEFQDADFEGLVTLGDLVLVVDRMMANLPPDDRSHTAASLIDAAVRNAFPSLQRPSKVLPLDEVFDGHELSHAFRKHRRTDTSSD